MVDVFISYTREHEAFVQQLAEAVRREGYSVWWDEELPAHLSYSEVISEKIGAAKAAIVVWSESAAASQWVRAEADLARVQKKLIQTSIDGRMPPMPFNQIQFASIGDWRGEDGHPGWSKVKQSLAALCGPRPGAGPAMSPAPAPAPAPAPEPKVVMPQPASTPPPAQTSVALIAALAGLVLLALVGALFFLYSGNQAAPTTPTATTQPSGSVPASAGPVRLSDPARIEPEPAAEPVAVDSPFVQAAVIDDPDGYTNVRSGASVRAALVARVNEGERFTTYTQGGEWWRVRLADGRTGYMARSRIRLIEPGAQR